MFLKTPKKDNTKLSHQSPSISQSISDYYEIWKTTLPHDYGREYFLQNTKEGFHIIIPGFICQSAEQQNHRSATSQELKNKVKNKYYLILLMGIMKLLFSSRY